MPRNNYEPYSNESSISGVYSEVTPSYDIQPMADIGETMTPDMGNVGGYAPTAIGGEDTQVGTQINDSVRRCVGWLVGTKGVCYGIDYHLHAGRNFIGRSSTCVVNLADPTISRNPSVQVIYDPKRNNFSIAPMVGSQDASLCYLNGEVLAVHTKLSAFDRLEVGDCELVFVPLCGEHFAWETDEKK